MVEEFTPLKNFDNLCKLNRKYKDKIVIVKFYLPYCGPCKATIPEYERLAELVKNNKKYKVAQLNGDEHRDFTKSGLCYGFDVESFPTIIIYKNTLFDSKCEVPRDADSWFNAMENT